MLFGQAQKSCWQLGQWNSYSLLEYFDTARAVTGLLDVKNRLFSIEAKEYPQHCSQSAAMQNGWPFNDFGMAAKGVAVSDEKVGRWNGLRNEHCL